MWIYQHMSCYFQSELDTLVCAFSFILESMKVQMQSNKKTYKKRIFQS